jgi:hypothetical protein
LNRLDAAPVGDGTKHIRIRAVMQKAEFGASMSGRDGIRYFERRAREEREKAENAADPRSYKLHLELAREYETRARHAQYSKTAETATGA